MKPLSFLIKDLKRLKKDNRGQLDLVGNIFSILQSQPWILLIILLALVYATTASINVGGVSINLYEPLNAMFGSIANVFGFGFDWRLIVIIIFFAVPIAFIMHGDAW